MSNLTKTLLMVAFATALVLNSLTPPPVRVDFCEWRAVVINSHDRGLEGRFTQAKIY
jgi:hypothetical protein